MKPWSSTKSLMSIFLEGGELNTDEDIDMMLSVLTRPQRATVQRRMDTLTATWGRRKQASKTDVRDIFPANDVSNRVEKQKKMIYIIIFCLLCLLGHLQFLLSSHMNLRKKKIIIAQIIYTLNTISIYRSNSVV